MRLFLFIGNTELIVIAALVLLLFGGKKIPELMRALGAGVNSFKRGMAEGTAPGKEAKSDPQAPAATSARKDDGNAPQ